MLRHVAYELAFEQWKGSGRGSFPAFVVDRPGELQSAIREPYATVGGRDLYPTLLMKAACLFRGLVKNHGLHDGNKRVAVTAVSVFLIVNGRMTTFTPPQLWKYALRVAKHPGAFPLRRIHRWLATHSVELDDPAEVERLADARRQALRQKRNTIEYVVLEEPLKVLWEPLRTR